MKLILNDKNKEQKAEILVESCTDGLVLGIIVSHSFDKELQQKIKEFEELVNTFTLSLLDEVTEQLDDYQWEITGKDWIIYDFQVFDLKDISFRIRKKKSNMLKSTDFIAELQFLAIEEGGRKTPVISGYRPHIEFEGHTDYITSGQQTYIDQKTVAPGEMVLAEISILSKDYFTNRLYENMKFEFYEGRHKMGSGKILEIVNLSMKMK